MRNFIRHPSDIPIKYRISKRPSDAEEHLSNISQGGLAFTARHDIEVGSILFFHIPFIKPAVEARGRVVWCHMEDGAYLIGVEFDDEDQAFHARMVEQICHIEDYKRKVLSNEGRHLTTEEAASEWIEKYADNFPAYING